MILHVDMDAFYASVEERDRPELVGKPVIVGGTPESRGVVAAANYVVRQFGVHSAMPSATAFRLCPQAIVIPPRIAYYAKVSSQIREIFERFTPLVEPVSLDEAFLDVTGSESLFGPAIEIARRIKSEIRATLRLVASVGVAPNKFLAKVASDLKKPDALVFVAPGEIQAFLDPLPVGRLWGVGRVTGKVFERIGIQTIGEVRRMSVEALQREFGRQGEHLWQLAHGIDDRRVIPDREAKSISHETTFAIDQTSSEVLRAWLLDLVEQVAYRLRRGALRGRTVNLKLRFSDFRTITRAQTLAEPTDITHEIWNTVASLLDVALADGNFAVRLIGVGVSGFENLKEKQLSLFPDESRARDSRLDSVRDQINAKFGKAALNRASGLQQPADHKRAVSPEELADDS
ncbi:MAG: dinB [Planctomycetaceae bacterium]|nr:dinB [Planctomycetaceae bacterium]